MIKRRLALHLSILLVGGTVLRVAAVPAEICPAITPAALEDSIEAAADWLIRGMTEDGRFTYGYHRGDDKVNTAYNYVRHGGATMGLYQVHAATGSPVALAAADRGLAHALPRMISGDGWTAWQPTDGDIPVGANGLLLASMALRRRATGDTLHDETMRSIGRFLIAQQQPDGSIYAYWDASQGAPRRSFGPFATGEASWALALLDGAFPGEGWGDAAARTYDYMGTGRNAKEGYLTSLPDHWAAYTVSEFRSDLLTSDRLDYARRLAGFFGIRLRFEAQRRGTGVNFLVRWFPGPPSGVGTAGEGMGALHLLSQRLPELADLRKPIEERLACAAGMMVERQVSREEAEEGPRPDLEEGAWFYRGYTQVDDQQHVLSTLLAALPVVAGMEEDG